MSSRYRIGIDVGGTFTDGIIVNEQTGETKITKVPSTPSDPSIGFLVAVERILKESKIKIRDIEILVHGTTVATNSIIEGKLAKTGFITTEGFRDLLEIQRQIRPSLYDLLFEKPIPLVPRYLCFGITERLDSKGNELIPLDEKSVVHSAEQLKKEAVEAIAICFLHSFLNPDHEQKCREIIKGVYPKAVISISSDVAPEFREYFRASTTVINAGIQPVVEKYLSKIESKLNEIGIKAKESASEFLKYESSSRNRALLNISEQLLDRKSEILDANNSDVENAISSGLSPSLIGRMKLDDLKLEYGIILPIGDYETIGGLVIDHLGKIPSAGEKFETANVKFRILKSTPSQIERIYIKTENPLN